MSTKSNSSSINNNMHPSPEPSGASGDRKRRKVTRSRLGCLTCRKRRKLCDQTKPTCDACTRLGLDCAWPSKQSMVSPELSKLGGPSHSNGPATPITPLHTSPSNAVLPSSSNLGGGSASGSASRSDETMSDFVNIWWDNAAANGMRPPSGPPAAPVSLDNMGFPGVPTPAPSGFGDFGGFLGGDGFNFDENTLRLWAADCLSLPSTQVTNPFDSLSSLLLSNTNLPPPFSTPAPIADSPDAQNPLLTSTEHAPISKYYNQFLRGLVAAGDPNSPNGVDSFTALANATASTSAGRGLHLSTLAWAGKHMVNQGQLKYEAVSEKLGDEASKIVLRNAEEWTLNYQNGIEGTETERLTLMAGILMLIQFKNTRGDVWGFQPLMDHLTHLCRTIYTPGSVAPTYGTVQYNFFANLVYHDVLSSFIFLQDPLVPPEVMAGYSYPPKQGFPISSKMGRVAQLVRRRRRECLEPDWIGEKMEALVDAAGAMQTELEDEGKIVDDFRMGKDLLDKDDFDIFVQVHEPYLLATALTLRGNVLCETPTSLNIRVMVRKALKAIEELCDRNLPGFCSCLWVLFVAACLAVPGGAAEGEMDERERAERLYEDMISTMGFLNASKSLKIVQEVWARNMEGRLWIDWLDIVKEWDWELFLA